MALMIVEIDSDAQARELVGSGEADVVLVDDEMPAYSEGGDQSFCRVFARPDILAAIRQLLDWDHPPDRALGDDFVVVWDLCPDDVTEALLAQFG